MKQRHIRLPARLGIPACLGACAGASLQAGQADAPLARAHTALNLATACAVLLAALALLLWRQHRLATRLQTLEHLRADAELARLACEQQKAREQERRRIGRDIHDDLGQHLLTLKIDLAMLQANSAATAPQLAQKLALIARNVDLSIAALRCVIDDLRPPALEHGWQAAFDGLLADFSRSTGIVCDGVCDALDGVAGAQEPLLYHALQEALANVARHAGASRVSVSLRRRAATLELCVSDNGVGMHAANARRGCGLSGMHERLACAGGCLHIDSRTGGGTRLRLSLPLPLPPADNAGQC
ncbi:sensor histidine kinase [Janthinobacterium sp. GW458P]|uniref:sensor histidine kinase n=1 Tax=Janthinobacterium sp. GW458P TaxID=1981504 RepID=UPI000A32241B|nr:sensor histidine kinase [Janthinobacterium sp. GW458P]MBE3024947.1 sensor histidine kinase [Janthinobacterium sp. GW458P]